MRIDLCAGSTLSCLLALFLVGCIGFGPATMRYQQSDYAAALADAGKRQALLNIVNLRYGDVPTGSGSTMATCRPRVCSA